MKTLRVYGATIKPVRYVSDVQGEIDALRVLLEGSWDGEPVQPVDQLALLIREELATDTGDVLVWIADEIRRRRK